MSEFFDEPEDEGNEEEFVPDPTTIAFLDQQQAEFGSIEDEFLATYGFKHECHCGEDYAAGRVGEITQCYHNMMQEALATCARFKAELDEVTGVAKALYQELSDRIETDRSSDGDGSGDVGDISTGSGIQSHSVGSSESAPESDDSGENA